LVEKLGNISISCFSGACFPSISDRPIFSTVLLFLVSDQTVRNKALFHKGNVGHLKFFDEIVEDANKQTDFSLPIGKPAATSGSP
jgi:hypothetical protein